jgi:hypothetical protein
MANRDGDIQDPLDEIKRQTKPHKDSCPFCGENRTGRLYHYYAGFVVKTTKHWSIWSSITRVVHKVRKVER